MVLLVGCGTIQLERWQDTSAGGVDPFGVCSHVDLELVSLCPAAALDHLACMEECVAAGGEHAAPFQDFDVCLHDAASLGGCQAVVACLQLIGAQCVAT